LRQPCRLIGLAAALLLGLPAADARGAFVEIWRNPAGSGAASALIRPAPADRWQQEPCSGADALLPIGHSIAEQ